METRRNFLKFGLAGIALTSSGGCEERRREDRVRNIRALQNSARSLAKYTPGEGFVYDVNVAGEKVHVNLSAAYFMEHNNLLKYTRNGIAVRVLRNGRLEFTSLTTSSNQPVDVFSEQYKADEIIQAVKQENTKLAEKFLKKYTTR